MEPIIHVSSSPHVRDNSSTATIMRDVIIALMPATLMGIYNFGARAFLVLLATCTSCLLTEYLWEKYRKEPITTGDLSALVTGLLLGLNLPATIPLWMAILGSVFAVLIAKQFFGGLGQNFMNPALAGRCFLMLSFGKAMTNSFAIPKGNALWGGYQATLDAVSSATPLMQVKEATCQADLATTLKDMFLGTTWGTIGETSVICLLIGGIYLLCRRVISYEIPLIYVLTFVVFNLCFSLVTGAYVPIFYEVCGGGLMLGAIFMATDYVTSPITQKGKIIYAILIGLLTGLFRFFGESAEGVSFAIIIGNLFVPLIERFTVPKAFGKEGKEHA